MRKVFKIGSLILFGLSTIAFIVFLILNTNNQNNYFELAKDISLATTVSASFSFSLSITIEIKNYYADMIYENCSFGDTENKNFYIKKKCNHICLSIKQYNRKINNLYLINKASICYEYFSKIWSFCIDVFTSYNSLEEKSGLEKEKKLIDELNTLSSTLSMNQREISASMLTNSKIIEEANKKLFKLANEYITN